MSLKEAKQVTAAFGGGSFVPPPRTIDDITAILDQQKLADPEEIARQKAEAEAEPPVGTSKSKLAAFYYERGIAAKRLGRSGQELADLREAARIVRQGASVYEDIRREIFHQLAWAEFALGNHKAAIESMLRATRVMEYVGGYSGLSRMYAFAGNLEEADKWRGRTIDALDEGRGGDYREYHRNVVEEQYLEAQGKWREAEPFARLAIDAVIRNDLGKIWPDMLPNRRSRLAYILLRQGRLVEAEIVARDTLLEVLGTSGKYSKGTAGLVYRLAGILNEEGRHEEGAALARAALDIYRTIGTPEGALVLNVARSYLATSHIALGDFGEALATFDAIAEGMAENRASFEAFFADNPLWAWAELKAGRPAEAKERLETAFQRRMRRLGAKHYTTAETRGLLAVALAMTGEREAALAAFAEAVPILMSRSRRTASGEAARDMLRTYIIESYIAALVEIGDQGIGGDTVAEAFRLASMIRGQSVERALSASSARAAAGNPDMADLVRREQDAQKQISSLFTLQANAVSVPTDQQDPVALRELRTRIDRLRGARAALMEEIERRFPDYADLINPKPATIAEARAALKPGEALIATYVGEEQTYVWAVPKTGEVEFAVAPLGRERLAAVVRDLRRALDPRATKLGDIPAFEVRLSYRLYKALLAPVKAGWRNARSLLVVAHGPLGQLPLSVLVTEPAPPPTEQAPIFSNYREIPWLARTHAVTVLPSVASLTTLRKLPAAAPGRRSFVGFADPWFSVAQAAAARSRAGAVKQTAALTARGLLAVRGLPIVLRATPKLEGVSSASLARLPRLPDTADEVKSIAVALNADLTRDVFTGKDANEGRVKTMTLSGYKVIAFATHGLVPGDLDGLTQPALALSAPEVAGVDGDGLLTMGEILGLKLDADWVVLSACNTAAAEGAGAEAISGLGRAFFYAGARALLVSNWPVETTSAKALTTDIFRRQAEDPRLTRAQALRQAMLGLIDGPGYVDGDGRTVFSYAHPIFWAPFSLVGDGGGAAPGA
ncbi:MAG: CHAT domain-containing protein [Proteobacteria bacterium]|nr:CHAT domain-containing protein [Pseudomonadota bacterium]